MAQGRRLVPVEYAIRLRLAGYSWTEISDRVLADSGETFWPENIAAACRKVDESIVAKGQKAVQDRKHREAVDRISRRMGT